MAFSPILSWKRKSGVKIKGVVWQIAASIIISAFAFILGLVDIIPLIIFMFFVLAILVNAEIGLEQVYPEVVLKSDHFAFRSHLWGTEK